MRGKAWQYLCGAHDVLMNNKGLFDVRNVVVYIYVAFVFVCVGSS